MAITNAPSSIDLINLDFDSLKESLKTYLSSQTAFKDYDFEGSNMSALLDVLAYNTFKNAFFLNMNISESFIDSAQMRDSILSISKALNYVPRSARSAKARVKVDFTATGDSQPYLIPKGSSFATLVKNESFIFTVPDNIIVASANTSFSFTTDIYEGAYFQDSYVFNVNAENKRYRISNKNIDTNSLTVTVFEDGSLIGKKYTKATSLLGLDELSEIYFMQASENGFFEIIFGDNIFGKQPKNNSIVSFDYRISNQERPNNASIFLHNFDPTGSVSELSGSVTITTITEAKDGAAPESIESIRYYAPRHFQIQERTIIPSDYEIALLTEFPEINAVACIGGEDRNPPQFGKIFIAVDLKETDSLIESKIQSYYNFIRARSPLKPVFVSPEYTYFRVNSKVRYNLNTTTLSPTSLEALIKNEITIYNDNNFDDFGVELRHSKFTEMIDDSDDSVISNITDISLYKKLNPKLATFENHLLKFNMELENNESLSKEILNSTVKKSSVALNTVFSSKFRFSGQDAFLEDDGAGFIRIIKTDGQFDTKIKDIGTVNYSTGEINIKDFKIDSYEGSYLKIYVRPKDKDILIPKDTIASIESDEILLEIEALRR